ncbi:hypothetical protein [Chitinophaga rhizophila]|uniref:Lipid-binding hydrolase n=1 Tax=Chitinophaga rhizophila TaxID=2866212 RepID=A0ABS7G7J5_9BACT|nr:hypothetical protein [Chitinophaga rhizophila]MBW8683614.1 hypothetical protein [Chitinophaga rhizophila]
MKKVLFGAAIAIGLFSACSKNEKNGVSDVAPENTFSLNSGNPVETPFGFRAQWSATGGGRLLISNVNVNDPSFAGKITGIEITIDTLIEGQTYMFMPADSLPFDKKKNFGIATTGLDVDFQNGAIVNGTGTSLTELRSGSVRIEKESDQVFRISYILDYTDAVIQGNYKGQMPEVTE